MDKNAIRDKVSSDRFDHADRRLRKTRKAAAMLFAAGVISTGPVGLDEALAQLLPRSGDPMTEHVGKQPGMDVCQAISSRSDSFDDVPFDDFDALVLATAAYLNFEETPACPKTGTGEDIALSDVASHAAYDKLLDRSWLYDFHGKEFLDSLSSSPRYSNVIVQDYVNDVSAEKSYQFCAVTFAVKHSDAPDELFVAFRGTDNSIAGWKEDADATYLDSTASQQMALEYLEDVASTRPDARIHVGGHSKGGNVSEYAAALCSDGTWDAIEDVYNFDGPGFIADPQGRFDTTPYNAKVSKILPQGSVFGRLFETRSSGSFTIVEAHGNPFAQHATTNWKVDPSSYGFCRASSFSKDSNIVSSTISEWAMSYDADKREQLIGAFFDVVANAGFSDWVDFKADPAGKTQAILSEIGDLDPEIQREVLFAVGRMAATFGENAVREASPFPVQRPEQ